jgi:UDP-glucose-4-epimerase GalE
MCRLKSGTTAPSGPEEYTVKNPHVLVVGGAGYIGSVCARVLRQQGCRTTVLDDLSTGHRGAVEGELIVGDIRDRGLLRRVFADHDFDAVMHFAARSIVGASVHTPLPYFDVNVGGTLTLLSEMQEAQVQTLVFSSTCAIYGTPQRLPLTEDHPFAPVSPYGESKQMVEEILTHAREKHGLRVTCLRYFNACGATLDGSLGEAHRPETHLIPLAIQAALGERPPLKLFGTDYPTRDGTCVRDYVHVLDLADAHWLALQRLLQGDRGRAYNVGTGVGTTVREVLDAVSTAVGTPVPYDDAPRRAGDPAELWADPSLVREDLGWRPRHTDILEMVRTATTWARAPRY